MTREKLINELVRQAFIAAEELGSKWQQTRGKKLMDIIHVATTRPRNLCLCGEGKGNHSGEQNMGGCRSTGCLRYRPVEENHGE